jgi:hypothetical protein
MKSGRQSSVSYDHAASTEESVTPSGSMNCMKSRGEILKSGLGSTMMFAVST